MIFLEFLDDWDEINASFHVFRNMIPEKRRFQTKSQLKIILRNFWKLFFRISHQIWSHNPLFAQFMNVLVRWNAKFQKFETFYSLLEVGVEPSLNYSPSDKFDIFKKCQRSWKDLINYLEVLLKIVSIKYLIEFGN
ncbi:MAG: hypothetical protein Ta2E_10610 [Mycoplasmoidaceae bacterium]|nr:MAG: hypothetical protein Ta2E_10610 [Mycoplasmoidaceae bacterium]